MRRRICGGFSRFFFFFSGCLSFPTVSPFFGLFFFLGLPGAVFVRVWPTVRTWATGECPLPSLLKDFFFVCGVNLLHEPPPGPPKCGLPNLRPLLHNSPTPPRKLLNQDILVAFSALIPHTSFCVHAKSRPSLRLS